jgi:PAS domain S-box-containing protein
MSLKTQLRISIVTLVTLLILAQCVVSLRLAAVDKFSDALDRAYTISDQVQEMVRQRVNEKARMVKPPPPTMEERRQLWHQIVEQDEVLQDSLGKALGRSTAVVEILICDENGRILVASTPVRTRLTYPSLPDFSEWKTRPLWDRLFEVMTRSKDYAIVVPIGVDEARMPIMSIRVVVSSVLIRKAIVPHVQNLAGVSLLTLMASIILAYLFSNVVLRSLDRLSKRIESIASGKYSEPEPVGSLAKEGKEFAAMQSKLDVLSQQFQGAKEDVVQLRGNIERMLEGLEEVILLFDTEHRLIRASRSAEGLLAMSRDDLAGRKLADLFPATTALGGMVREAIECQKPIRDATVTIDRPSGLPVRVLVNVELLESYPQPGRFSVLLTLRDVETRRQLRSQLDISTRLAAISRLTGGVAHEIKNPLNAMALHLEILRGRLADRDEVQSTVDVIGGEIARLDRVVKTFLDFTRPVEVCLREINLVEMTRQVAELVWPEAESRRVSVEFDSPQSAAMIRGDDDLLKQALLNVVNNGIEAMSLGGRLRIRIARERDEFVVSVVDQGGGIPEELKEKIFNLYFSTKEKGSGIGLAMTFRIIQLHNATIDFLTHPGEGTTFFLRFPVVEDASGPVLAPATTELEPAASEGRR